MRIFLILLTALVIYPLNQTESNIKESQITKICKNYIAAKEIEEAEPTETPMDMMTNRLDEIESIDNNKEWFIEYKKVMDEFSYLGTPDTIYDYYTEDEIFLICRAVETECYDQSFDSKCNVASVIINRIETGGEFGESVEEVITSENQFAYGRKEVTEDTILSVEYAFSVVDTTGGCIAFRSDKDDDYWIYNEWYDGWEYVFTDEAGHNFFREEVVE